MNRYYVDYKYHTYGWDVIDRVDPWQIQDDPTERLVARCLTRKQAEKVRDALNKAG